MMRSLHIVQNVHGYRGVSYPSGCIFHLRNYLTDFDYIWYGEITLNGVRKQNFGLCHCIPATILHGVQIGSS